MEKLKLVVMARERTIEPIAWMVWAQDNYLKWSEQLTSIPGCKKSLFLCTLMFPQNYVMRSIGEEGDGFKSKSVYCVSIRNQFQTPAPVKKAGVGSCGYLNKTCTRLIQPAHQWGRRRGTVCPNPEELLIVDGYWGRFIFLPSVTPGKSFLL